MDFPIGFKQFLETSYPIWFPTSMLNYLSILLLGLFDPFIFQEIDHSFIRDMSEAQIHTCYPSPIPPGSSFLIVNCRNVFWSSLAPLVIGLTVCLIFLSSIEFLHLSLVTTNNALDCTSNTLMGAPKYLLSSLVHVSTHWEASIPPNTLGPASFPISLLLDLHRKRLDSSP